MAADFVKRWLGNRKMRRAACKNSAPHKRLRPRLFRPFLEVLEERILLSTTLVVNNPTDTAVANELSLRQAVTAANADAAKGISDTITLDPSLGSSTLKLTQGTLELKATGKAVITIDGSAPSLPITLDGSQNNGSIFQVDAGAQVVLQNLNFQKDTLSSGNGGAIVNDGTLTVNNAAFTGNSAATGGAIENKGTLTLSNVVLTSNSATGSSGQGGALDNSGTATVLDSTFSSNSAVAGGAISNEGTLTLTNTTFANNSASGSGGAIDSTSGSVTVTGGFITNNNATTSGGAIENQAVLNLNGTTLSGNSANLSGAIDNSKSGTLTVQNATLSDNTAYSNGGGIGNTGGMVSVLNSTLVSNRAYQNGGALENSSGTLTLVNSTLTGNVANDGGGIETDSGTLTISSSTISGNTANSSGGGINNNGGKLALGNTILVGNTSYGSNADFAGSITTDNGYNLLGVGVGGSTGDPHPGPGDVFNNTPSLSALGNYGGPTQTMALLSGSPAIGAGNAAAANLPSTDQRGQARTLNGKLDIGAFQTQAPTLAFTTLGQTVTAGQKETVTVQLQDPDGNPAPVGTVSYSGNGTTADASGSSNLTLVGGAGFAAGKNGQAISLNGNNQYAITPNLANLFPNGDANVTVSLSFNAAGAGVILDELGQAAPNTNWHDSQLEVLSDGTVEARVWNLPAVTLGKVGFNSWHTVVLRYNAATQTLDGFLDGVQSSKSSSGGHQTPYSSGYGLYYAFGAGDGTNLGSGASFKGLIQNITIFNRALSNAEVKSLGTASTATTLTLSSSSSGGSFFNANGQPISNGQIIVPPGASSVTFEYADTKPGTPTLSVSAPGFATATQQETILPAPVSATPTTDIVVGRTLSSYTTSGIRNGQETITYTVYNESSDPLTGVLLTDTLEPGVTVVSASQQPDQSGQNLAWSLGTIQGYDRASVTLTVALPSTIPLQLDTGAQAFATLDGGSVSNSTPAATLTKGNVDPNLLASTPDANTTDPYIQEEATRLGYNAQNIFNFLHNDIGYNSYLGSLRGARGTLWSSAGNALDVASLGVALLRASGIAAQYVSGTLSHSQAQQLILSMFPNSYQTVGYVPSGTQTSDPANDPQLLSETESHYWFQFDTGNGMADADPLLSGTIGQTVTASTGTFTEVPDNLRAKTEVSLTAETYSQAAAAFGLNPFQDTVVLDQTFNDVDLVGHPLTVGNLVTASGLGAIITTQTFTYTPYLILASDGVDPSKDPMILGQTYQEVETNFPLGNQIVTGLFLDMKEMSADGTSTTYEKTLADRIGIAARQNGTNGSLSVQPGSAPLISPLDLTTISVNPSQFDPHLLTQYSNELNALAGQMDQFRQENAGTPLSELAQDTILQAQATSLMRNVLIASERARIAQFQSVSDEYSQVFANDENVRAYFDSPRLTVMSSQVSVDSQGNLSLKVQFDLLKDDIRALAAPGQNQSASFAFRVERGFLDTQFEASVLGTAPSAAASGLNLAVGVSVPAIFSMAQQQGIPLVILMPGDTARLDAMNLPTAAKALISDALANGKVVVVPAQGVEIDGQLRVAWYEIDSTTGQAVGVLDDGSHGVLENVATFLASFLPVAVAQFGTGLLAGLLSTTIAGYVKQLLIQTLLTKLGAKQAKAAAVATVLGLITTIKESEERFLFRLPAFFLGFSLGIAWGTRQLVIDPPLPSGLLGPSGSELPSTNTASGEVNASASTTGGSLQGTMQTRSIAATGQLAATWNTSAGSSNFATTSLTSAQATIADSSGRLVGTGTLSVTTPDATAAIVSGNMAVRVKGTGSLSFYGPAESSLGVGGTWSNYSATVTGNVSITLTVPDGALTLNGKALPAGTYTITTSSATLAGSGNTTSPNFAGSSSVTTTNGTVNLGSGSGNVTVGGKALDVSSGATLDGYTGSIAVAAGGSNNVDNVAFKGNAANVLTVSTTSNGLTTDQNTPVTFKANVNTSLADTYTLTAKAPPGWTVTIDTKGNVTATPAPGLQGGTYSIQIVAQSMTDPNLVAQTTVNVAITPTQPGMTLAVNPDPLFTVPFDGAQVPSAFQAVIHNIGPTADTYNLTFSNVPSGFTVLSSATSVTIPAGQTGIIGIYLQPTGNQLPAPGTQVSFNITATSTTNSAITQTQNVSFTMPNVDAVTVTDDPTTVNTMPGTPVTTTVTLKNVGNVPETITLTAATPSGLKVSGLNPVSLAIGQTTTETITLTPNASTPLGSMLQATITATFGPSASPVTQTLTLPVNVVVPGVPAIANAAVAAQQIGNTNLANQLGNLSTALTNLVQHPTSAVYNSQAVAAITSIVSQVTNDPFLAPFAGGLTAGSTAISKATTVTAVQTAVTNLGTALNALSQAITDEAAHGFTLSLSPSVEVVQPSAPETFDIVLANKGTAATTYDLSVSGLPSGVKAVFNQAKVTLQPGQSITSGNNAVTLTLTESGATLVPASFTVTAVADGASEITLGTPGQLTLRQESILVAGVTTNPPFTNAGGKVAVSAQIQDVVNEPQQVMASYTVTDSNGKVLFTSKPMSVALSVAKTLTTVALGTLDTTGYANGTDTITVTLTDANGKPIAGASGIGSLVIGSPVTGSITTTSTTVPTGSPTVTTTVQVNTAASYPAPLSLEGAVTTPAPGTSVALYQSGGKTYAYESGTGGMDVIDVTDSANPKFIEAFGQKDVVNGQFGFNLVKVINGKLFVATEVTNNGSGFNLLVYSLADPSNPTLISNTAISYHYLTDMLVNSTGTAVYVPTDGVDYWPSGSGGSIFNLFGDVVSIDLSKPTQPTLGESLFNNQGQPQGGDMSEYGGTLVNDSIAYITGLTPGGGNVTGNTGNLMVVNVADPKNMKVITSLTIPGTFNVLGVATDGNRALVVGTAGKESSTFDFKATGVANNLTLTVLDISNPDNPKILGSTIVTNEQYPLNEAGAKTDVVSLGNGNFAISDNDANGKPDLLVVNINNPSDPIIAATQVPSGVHGITVSGDTLYASTSSGLSIYKISSQLVSDPVTITVHLPAGAAANIVPGSYNIPPTKVITSSSGDTLVWDRYFASGNTTYTFTWQTKLSNVQAGETIPITTGTTATYTSQGTAGTLKLPGTSVTGVSFVSLSPKSQSVQPGATANYDVQLTNPTNAPITYYVQVHEGNGDDFSNVSVNGGNSQVTVAAGATVDVPLQITADEGATAGDEPFTVEAYDANNPPPNGADGTTAGDLKVSGPPLLVANPVAYGVVLSLTPSQATIGQGTSTQYVIQVTNTGSSDDQYDLQVSGLPSGVSYSFDQNYRNNGYIDVPPGAGNFRDVTLTLTAPQGTKPGSYPFTVMATSTNDKSETGTTNGSLKVTANGVSVSLDKSSGAPGDTFEMTVTNTGTVTDTFNLTVGGPSALVAKLDTKQVTLAAGASQTVSITTSAVNFATQGALNLVAIATSQTNPAVTSQATAALTIPTTTGLSAKLTPVEQTLPKPGATSYVVQVQNTGNIQDAYTATITGISGPITASLIGLDGKPTQTISIFYLPGLSTGALQLQTTATGAGKGTVTVEVRSLTNANAAPVTATLTVQPQNSPSPPAASPPSPPPSPIPAPPATTASTPTLVGLSSAFDSQGLMASVALYSNGDLYLVLPGFSFLLDTGISAAHLYNDARGNFGLAVVLQGSGATFAIDSTGTYFLGAGLLNLSMTFGTGGQGTLVDTSPLFQTLAFGNNGAALLNLGGVINVFADNNGQLGADFVAMPNGMLIEVDSQGVGMLPGGVLDASTASSPAGGLVHDLVLNNGRGFILTPEGPFDVTALLAGSTADSPAAGTGTLFSYYLSLLGGQATSTDVSLSPVFASSERVLGDINALAGGMKSMGTQSGSDPSMAAEIGQLISDLRADPLALPLSSFYAAVLRSDAM